MTGLATPRTEPIRVVVADDSFLVREAVARLLAEEETVEIAAVCDDAASLLAAVERERPHVVVVDIRMPLADGERVGVAAELRLRDPSLGVVVLSAHAEPRLGAALLARGSVERVYLLMDHVHDRGQLVAAIEAVAHCEAFVDAQVVERMLAPGARAAASRLADLSPREREILAQIATGKSNARIAADLVLTKRAVEKHINAIFLKLGLRFDEGVSRRVKAALMHLEATAPDDR